MSLSLPRKTKSRKPRQTGLPPGTLVHRGEKRTEKSQIDVIQYNKENLSMHTYTSEKNIQALIKLNYTHWINIDGLHNISLIKAVGNYVGLNNLILEDILNTEQRPKLDIYDDHMFFPMKILYLNQKRQLESEQISLVLGENFLLSFREMESDHFSEIMQHLNNPESTLRQSGHDYLFYRLIDVVVDHYFEVMDEVNDNIDLLEEEVYFNPTSKTIQVVQSIKKELIQIRRTLYPMKEALMKFQRSEHPAINRKIMPYFADISDHLHQLIESFETYSDLVNNLTDVYMSSISTRMNEIMKVLTIISTIFIPLSFIAGVYGMNFQNMPELSTQYGYFVVLGIMFSIMIIMLIFFRKKKWF